jgi:hypothetical protein
MNKNDHDLFDIMKKYCLNKKNISTILKKHHIQFEKNIVGEISEQNACKKINKNKRAILKRDVLFWMYYIFQYGSGVYDMIGKNKYSAEMKEKTKIIQDIKLNKSILKQYKLKYSDIESDLLYSKKISIHTLFIILQINQINFIYYTDHIIYVNKTHENLKTMYIYHNKKDDIYEEREKIDIETLMENRLKIDILAKPLRAISHYKAGDIKDICKKLNIEIMKNSTKSFTKKVLYEKIVQKIN